jgi:hypothetical protein
MNLLNRVLYASYGNSGIIEIKLDINGIEGIKYAFYGYMKFKNKNLLEMCI